MSFVYTIKNVLINRREMCPNASFKYLKTNLKWKFRWVPWFTGNLSYNHKPEHLIWKDVFFLDSWWSQESESAYNISKRPILDWFACLLARLLAVSSEALPVQPRNHRDSSFFPVWPLDSETAARWQIATITQWGLHISWVLTVPQVKDRTGLPNPYCVYQGSEQDGVSYLSMQISYYVPRPKMFPKHGKIMTNI